MENDDTKKYGTFDESDGSDSDVNTNYHFDSNEIIDCESNEYDFDLSMENNKLFGDHTKNDLTKLSKCCVLRYIILCIMTFAVTGIYLHSLDVCPYDYSDPNVCIGYFRKMYPIWLFMVIICALITYGTILLCLYNVFSKFLIIVPIFNFIFCFLYQSGMEMDNHGGINRATFAISLGVLITLHLIILFIYCSLLINHINLFLIYK